MWQTERKDLSASVHQYTIRQDECPLSYRQTISLWKEDELFREFFSQQIRESSFEAVRWETACVTKQTLDRDFEFVLVESRSLDRPVDQRAFAEHFKKETSVIATFPNLGRNAVMIVPCPIAGTDIKVYGHLSSFLRGARESQCQQLWQSVAVAMQKRVSKKPVWLSTAGMGVSWLHVRLDDRPKYYHHAPYRNV